MTKDNGEKQIKVIKEAFNDTRNITGFAPAEMINVSDECYYGGDIFITDEGELIDLEYQVKDFDEVELVKYVELAEELYEMNNVPISIYILCPKSINVLVPECKIHSYANFTIKLASFESDPTYSLLNHIKEKVDSDIPLDNEDLEHLSMIPMMVSKEHRRDIRVECFRILSEARR